MRRVGRRGKEARLLSCSTPRVRQEPGACRDASGGERDGLSAQLLCCLEDGFFQQNAARANRLAARIGAAAGTRLLYPVGANAVFLQLRDGEKQALRARGFGFYDWGAPRANSARFVVSWDQSEADVDALCEALSGWN